MRHLSGVVVLTLFGAVLFASSPATAQQDASDGARKVVDRVVPAYPSLARQFNVKGSVKLEAVVASDGSVKSISVKGGHPLLVDAAETAIRKWKYAPAKADTTETIEVHFDSQ
jgi:TonB family protein